MSTSHDNREYCSNTHASFASIVCKRALRYHIHARAHIHIKIISMFLHLPRLICSSIVQSAFYIEYVENSKTKSCFWVDQALTLLSLDLTFPNSYLIMHQQGSSFIYFAYLPPKKTHTHTHAHSPFPTQLLCPSSPSNCAGSHTPMCSISFCPL